MSKMLRKSICIVVVLIMSVAILCACNNKGASSIDDFNAVVLDRANGLVKDEFLESVPSHEHFGGKTILLVKDKDKFNEIFIDFPMSLDFEKDMLIVYVYTDLNYGFPYVLKDICNENGTLMLYMYADLLEDEFGTPPCASAPTQRCVVIKMKKENVTEVKIIGAVK